MKKAILLIIAFFIPLGVFAQDTSSASLADNRSRAVEPNFCDPNFIGGPISFMQTAELTLDDLISQIHNRFGVNFLIGPNVSNLPINIKTNNIPWNTLLSSQLYLLGVRPTCVNSNTIQLVKNDALAVLEERELQTAKLGAEFIKLRYLQPTTGGNVDVAGNSSRGGGQSGCQGSGQGSGQSSGQGNCGTFEKLITEIEKILGGNYEGKGGATKDGDTDTVDNKTSGTRTRRGSVSVVPGRNILVIRGSQEQLAQIRQIIALADRPPFQVVVKGLVYTANENLLRDIGVQSSIIFGTSNLNTLGGIVGQPGVEPPTIDPATGLPSDRTGRPVPGGIRSLGPGFEQPPIGGSLFGFSTLIGTAQFSVQATALQQNGVISIKSRPFATVLDGETTELDIGRQIAVLTQGSVIGGNAGNLEFINAANKLSVTPHVIDDENGNPVAVNLELQLTSNDVDASVFSQDIPAVNVRSIQTRLILNQDKTVILGGFTVDSDSKTVAKTPGLGDIPILGNLFKRRVRSNQVNRLYFAIAVSIIPYGAVIEPVVVPGATTNIPSITPEMLKRSKEAPSVVPLVKDKP